MAVLSSPPSAPSEWPPRSPDLSICDFFLWGYLKEKVFRSRPHNLEELKMRIREEIAAIPLEMCRRAAENFRHRLQQCIATDGHHLPDAIFTQTFIVITQMVLYTDSNKTKNNSVSIVLLFLIAFQNCSIGYAPPCIT